MNCILVCLVPLMCFCVSEWLVSAKFCQTEIDQTAEF